MEYKRKTREMSPETKKKISKALRNRPKSLAWRTKISIGQKRAWSRIAKSNSGLTLSESD